MTKYFVCFAVLALIVILVTAPPVPENIGVVMFDHAQEDFEAKGLFTFKKLSITYFWVELISNELIFQAEKSIFKNSLKREPKTKPRNGYLPKKNFLILNGTKIKMDFGMKLKSLLWQSITFTTFHCSIPQLLFLHNFFMAKN